MPCNMAEQLDRLQRYLRIPTAPPDIQYDEVINFLRAEAFEAHLHFEVVYLENSKKPIVILSWIGKEPLLPSIILNSSMDVTPVGRQKWKHPPFDAEIDYEGNIYARGVQHSKSNAMQYISAIRELQAIGVKVNRTVHVTFMPETGTQYGLKGFVQSEHFKKMNPGFLLDAGLPSPHDSYYLFHGQRNLYKVEFIIYGRDEEERNGDDIQVQEDTTSHKMHFLMKSMMNYRQEEFDRLQQEPQKNIEDIIVIELKDIRAISNKALMMHRIHLSFEVHLAYRLNREQFEKKLRAWIQESGGNVELIFTLVPPKIQKVELPGRSHFYFAMTKALKTLNVKFYTFVNHDDCDTRYVREAGTPCLSFSPINKTEIKLCNANEYLNTKIYGRGVHIYKTIIPSLANV